VRMCECQTGICRILECPEFLGDKKWDSKNSNIQEIRVSDGMR
jgi:hypothetical protein